MSLRQLICVELLLLSAVVQADSLLTKADDTWRNLWRTPDQQAQQALNAGDAKQAAKLFNDPRRRAYAETKAGEYADAAKRLAPFADAESQYNRGNALARAGDLQAALSAYDQALKQAATDSTLHRDAQHNRDLVAKQLQQNLQQPSKNSSQQGGQRNQQNQQNSSQGSQSSQSSSVAQQANSPSQTSGANASHSSSVSSQHQNNGNAAAQSSSTASQAMAQHAQQTASSASSSADAQQAQRDAQAALPHSASSSATSSQSAQWAQAPDADATDKHPQAQASTPPSEQSLALEQWLRQIPDDPGGLLRRKFLIEHMLKQRQAQSDETN